MFSKFFARFESSIMGGAILIAAASFASRLLGLLRDRLLFSRFGAGDTLDSYYAAFRLPDLLFQILILGALSSAFIPVFLQYRAKEKEGGHEESWDIANTVLTIIVIALTALAVVAFFLAPWVVPLFAPGFDGEKLTQTVFLTRIMLGAIVFFGASNIVSSILNAARRFAAFAISPILYNVGILVGILWLYPQWGITGLGLGVVLGALLHLLVQLPPTFRIGWRYRWPRAWKHRGVSRIFRLMGPRMVGLGALQLEQLACTLIASTLATGSVAIFNAAQNLASFPINIFGVSLAVSSFPVFAAAFAEKRTDDFVREFSRVARRILFVIIPLSVIIVLLRAHIVRVVLGAGNFDWDATIRTAQSLGFLSLTLFAQSLIPMLARSFYALQDTKTPMATGVSAVLVSVVLAVTLGPRFGVEGLALAVAAASGLHMVALFLLLRHRLGELDDLVIITSTIKIIVASAAAGFATWLTLLVAARGVNQATFIGIFLQALQAASVGTFVYVCLALLMRFDEVRLVGQWLRAAQRQLIGLFKRKNQPSG